MTENLINILLIDDSEADNFFHKMIIEDAGCSESIVAMTSAIEALEYLRDPDSPNPDLIFLDINMPAMDGWEFLQAYEQWVGTEIDPHVIVMLTTSLNPAEAEKAKTYRLISRFFNKPLTTDMVSEVAAIAIEQ